MILHKRLAIIDPSKGQHKANNEVYSNKTIEIWGVTDDLNGAIYKPILNRRELIKSRNIYPLYISY